MNFSLNEVEALAKKATRGAGYPWGLAEEAAKSTRFLCAHGLDGCSALAKILNQFDKTTPDERCPSLKDGVWTSAQSLLCPITVGSVLSDYADTKLAKETRLTAICQPMLLIPFAANIARAIQNMVSLEADGAVAVTDGNNLSLSGHWEDLASSVRVTTGGSLGATCEGASRAHPDALVWNDLNAFAHRTYAPATEESRRKGAG